MNSADVIIAGAGIIGISIALELRARNLTVLLLDRGEPGREASSAAAGMLAAADPETPTALRPLAVESARLYPEFVAQIENASGICTDFRRHGTIAMGDHLRGAAGHRGLTLEELKQLESVDVMTAGSPAFLVAEDSVDPSLLMKAALEAAARVGIQIRGGVSVRSMQSFNNGVVVTTDSERLSANAAINCCGAWSSAPVKPRKGQIFYLQPRRPGMLEHVLRAPDVYVVPRSSGKILVGATVEDVGFDKTVEFEAIHELHRRASRYIPALADAQIVESWAGLRPGTPDDLPLMGETDQKRLFIAGGHFRNGILLAPITARTMANLITGNPPGITIAAFAPQRFTLANATRP